MSHESSPPPPAEPLVPTLCVGMPSSTLRVVFSSGRVVGRREQATLVLKPRHPVAVRPRKDTAEGTEPAMWYDRRRSGRFVLIFKDDK